MATNPELAVSGVAKKSVRIAIGPTGSKSRKLLRRGVIGRDIGCCGVVDGGKITSNVVGAADSTTRGHGTPLVGRGDWS